jgi:uncharacterized protein (TIGR02302 family)
MSERPQDSQDAGRRLRGLRRRRLLARLVLLFERVWPALWPPLGLLGAWLCLALLDLPRLLPPAAHLLLLAVLGLAALGLLARGLGAVRAPRQAEADRRLERASGLSHRPLAVLFDRPAAPGAEALWQVHVARAAAQLARLRVGVPHPGLAARDRRALRGGLIVALVASLVVAGAAAPERLQRAFTPAFVPPPAPPATQLQAWITPPGYTGQAPLFLKTEGGAVSVPAGSHLTVSLTGGAGRPTLALDGAAQPFQALDDASFQADLDLVAGGRLAVRRRGRELAGWDLTVVGDAAPMVNWSEPPGVARAGTRLPQTRLPWEVSHAYGVVGLQAELYLRDRADAAPLVVTIPLPGGAPKQARGVRLADLTAHPWAGLAVRGRLVARDAPGLAGSSAEAGFTLPERRFDNPVARALMEVRKMLSLRPDDRLAAIRELDRLSDLDAVWQADAGGFLNLRAIASELYRDAEPQAVEEAQSRLWQLALHLEEGAADRTAEALRQARQAVRDALDADKRGEKLPPGELDRRMQELERALQQHLQALAEQARRNPDSQPLDPEAQQFDAREARRLAEEMRQAGQRGDMDTAREKMAELEQMLEALEQASRPEHGNRQAEQRARQRQRGQQQMSVLQDIVRREGGVLDHAQARNPPGQSPEDLRKLFGFPRPGPQAGRDQPPGPADRQAHAAERDTDQRVQQALRRALGELMQQYGELTGAVPQNLGEADRAMRDAAQALGAGQDGPAADSALRAIEALQQGGQSMSRQLAARFGQDSDQEGDDDGQDGPGMAMGNPEDGTRPGGGSGTQPLPGWPRQARRGGQPLDPLGRPLREGTSGSDENSDVTVPDQMEAARTRAIQEELRRRGAERGRPQPELDYIDRLLKQF